MREITNQRGEAALEFEFQSSSSPTIYKVQRVTSTGALSCNCPGWTFKKKDAPNDERTCKHVREVSAWKTFSGQPIAPAQATAAQIREQNEYRRRQEKVREGRLAQEAAKREQERLRAEAVAKEQRRLMQLEQERREAQRLAEIRAAEERRQAEKQRAAVTTGAVIEIVRTTRKRMIEVDDE